ncbi:UDP-N-acetylglucosamine 2-epimerase [Qipengyuania seohaensis]|uniref:UDP-N-acetylglucosamine 2-epimerase n=1 Tax=Qipengyuania seohaensis TaxID=266951 RepID=UPI000C2273EA|nr:UDP-N-acetylglucosamine 2-epimerase [Qipengyuania seohaensis]
MRNIAPIEVVIGTKAQYIKTAPVLRELRLQNIPYRLIDTGQHAALSPAIRAALDVDDPEVILANDGNVTSIGHAVIWSLKLLLVALFQKRRVQREIFDPQSQWCIIHGDTPTTFLSLLLAKRAGKKVVHLEAGLRSFRIFRPFPEELVRIFCMHFSDLLFVPSTFALQNARKMGLEEKSVLLPQNTNVEALEYALTQESAQPIPDEPFALVTTHRVETILNKQNLRFVIDAAQEVATTKHVVFVLHDPTERRLLKYGWMEELLTNNNITLQKLTDHPGFVRLLDNCDFVMTDGGSIQEEAYFLDKPCLVLRSETERDEGLATNVRLANFDTTAFQEFLKIWPTLRRGEKEPNLRPSRLIVDHLIPIRTAH